MHWMTSDLLSTIISFSVEEVEFFPPHCYVAENNIVDQNQRNTHIENICEKQISFFQYI